MKKKLLSIVLCIAMLFTFSASGALAEEIETENQTNTEQNIEMNVDDSNQDITEENPVDDEIGDVNTDENQSSEEGTDISEDDTDVNTDTDANGEISDTPQNPQEGSDVVPEDSDLPTGSQDYSTMSTEELYAYIMQLGTDEEVEAVLAELPQETIEALEAYAQEQVEKIVVQHPKTVEFTDAGPLMPPVKVEIEKKLKIAMQSLFHSVNSTYALDNALEAKAAEDNGLQLKKEVVSVNPDGSYTISLQSWTTGTVTTSTEAIPVDVVLVLDQSGSMNYGFEEVSWDYINEHKDEIFWTKPNSIGSTDDSGWIQIKYSYGTFKDSPWSTRTGEYWHSITGKNNYMIPNYFYSEDSYTYYRAVRQDVMQSVVNSFIDKVSEKANADNVNHRISIVNFANDGSIVSGGETADSAFVDTLNSTSDVDNLKNTVSNLATPAGGTYIDKGLSNAYEILKSDTETGTRNRVVIVLTDGYPGSGNWTSSDKDTANAAITTANKLKANRTSSNPGGGATIYSIGIFEGADPTTMPEMPSNLNSDTNKLVAANRFMHLVSSNYVDATDLSDAGDKNTKGEYYLAAASQSALDEIFTRISNQIASPTIQLDSSTVVKDTVSKYFDVPKDVSDIRFFTEDYDGTTFTGKRVIATDVRASISGNSIMVSGFDYNKYFVSNTQHDGTYGKKLIIEFEVKPNSDFIGGNDVPTNDWENSGVYESNGTEVEKFADARTTPTVNVPIKRPEFSVNNKTIYEGNSTEVRGLYTLPDTTGWQYDYVKVTVSGVDTKTVSPTDCAGYKINVNYAPITNGSSSEGTANDMTGKSTEQTATVHVLKHDVTAAVNDVQKYYGESYTLGDFGDGKKPVITVEWIDTTNSHTGIPTAEGTAPYKAEDLKLSYETSGAASGNNVTVPKADFDVTVTVMKDGSKISDAKIITNCTFGCTDNPKDGGYRVHVKTCQLTVAKAGGAAGEPYVFTVKKDGEKYSEITVVGNTSEMIYELPVGTYTIEEDTGWGWRYTPGYNSSSVTLGSDNSSGTINCTNTSKSSKWLNGFSSVVKNIYGIVKQ